MNRLRDQISVDCSVGDAESRLESYFASLRGKDGVARMRLRVPVRMDRLALHLDREVRVEALRTRDDENLNEVIRITWSPEGTAVFPIFSGTLAVWAGESDRSVIELDGGYTPPFGVTGKAFDAVIGHRIAQSTAREFLGDLKRVVERP